MKKIYIFLFSFLLVLQIKSQFVNDWNKTFVANGNRIYKKSIIVSDNTDNALVSYGFDVIDSLGASNSFTHPGGAITVKYTGNTGTQSWIKSIEDNYCDLAGQAVSSAGVVSVGITAQSAGGNKDIRVYRYSSSGTQTWLHTFNGPGNDNDYAADIASDASNNILVCGTYDSDLPSSRGLLVYKLSNSSGTQMWAKNIPFSGSIQNGLKVITDGASSVYTLYQRITGSVTTFGVAGFLADGTDLYNTQLSIPGFSQLVYKDFSCDLSGNCYVSFIGISSSNTYNLVVIKVDVNGIASNFLSISLNGNGLLANSKLKVETNSAQIVLAYDNISNSSVDIKRYNSSAVEVWNTTKTSSSLADFAFSSGVSPNLFLLSNVSGSDGSDISITRYTGATGALIGNTNYDIPLANSIDQGKSINVSSTGSIFCSGNSTITNTAEKCFAARFNASVVNLYTKTLLDFNDGNVAVTQNSSGDIFVLGNSKNSSNLSDAYIAKYSSLGAEQWRFQTGKSGSDDFTAAKLVACDASGNSYFAGVESNTNKDIFIYKLNALGRIIWKNVYNHSSNLDDLVSELILDSQGNIVVVGTTRQTSLNRNVLVLKYSSNGTLLYNLSYDGPLAGDDFARSVVSNSNGEVYVACELKNTGNQSDAAILKVSASGVVIWQNIIQDNFGDDIAVKIKLDNVGNPIILSNTLVASGSYDGRITKVSSSNSTVFTIPIGTIAINDQMNDFDVNASNQIAVTGQTGNSTLDRDIINCRLSASGSIDWTTNYVGLGLANDFGYNCSISSNGVVYAGGTSKNASNNDDVILLCYDGAGVLQQNLSFGISTNTIDQASQLFFNSSKAIAVGLSNPLANNDGLTAMFSLPILSNVAPIISSISNQNACSGIAGTPISISLTDEDLNSVVLSATSNNTSLIPNGNIVFSGTGANRTVSITPMLNQSGSATITIIATDAGNLSSQIQFNISVTSAPTAATITAGSPTSFCSGGNVVLSVPSQSGVNYQWKLNNNNIGTNSNSLTATAAGNYTVEISNTCGTVSSTNSISVTISSAPTAATITAGGSTSFCSGGNVVLSVPNQSGVNYQWKLNSNNIGTNSNSITATAAGNYTVDISNTCGTVSSTNSISVTISSAPTAATITAGGSTSFCSGGNVVLSVPSQLGVNYQWKLNSNNIGTNSNSLTATTAGSYTVDISNSCGTSSSSNTILVSINPNPTDVTIFASGSTSLCLGGSVDLSVISESGVNYQWKLDGNNVGTNLNSITATNAGVYSLEISNSCATILALNSINVSIAQPLNPSIISAGGPTEFCLGDSVELSINSSANVNYQWYLESNPISVNSNSIYALLPGNYSVSVTNACETVFAPNIIKISVFEFPLAQSISANGSTTICQGSNVLLSTTFAAGLNFEWFLEGNSLGLLSNEISADQPGVYSLQLSNVCGSINASNDISVSVLPLPVSSNIFSASTQIPCNGGTITINVNPQPGVNYQWKQDGLNIGLNTNFVDVSSAGIINLELSNACGTVNSANSIEITAPTNPISQTIITNGPTEICTGGIVILSVPNDNNVDYQWKLNNVAIGTNSNSLVASNPGVYSLEIYNVCSSVLATNTITVQVQNPIQNITISASGPTSICQGQSVDLAVPEFANSNYQWLLNGANIGIDSLGIAASIIGDYSVEVTNVCGTFSSSNFISVVVNSAPIPQQIISNGNPIICDGNPIELSVTFQNGVNYQWKKDGVNIGSNQNVLSVNNAGTYSLEISNNCGLISAVNQIIVSIGSFPTIPSITEIGSTSICTGQSVQLSVPIQASVNYQWLINGNNIGTNSNEFLATIPGNYTVELSNICGTITSSNSIVISLSNPPNFQNIQANGSLTFCEGGNVQLSVISDPNVSYQWKLDGTNIGTNSNLIIASQSGVYTLEITNTCGTISAGSPATVTTISSPTIPTISANGPIVFCSGGSVTLTTGNQIGSNFQWTLNGNNVGTNSNSFVASASGVYKIEVSNTCGFANSIDSIIVLLETPPNAPFVFANGPTQFCVGDSVQISTTFQPGVQYQWLLNGIDVSLNQNSNYFSQAGTYTVEVSNSCLSIVSNNSVNVTLNPLPNNQIINSNGLTTICQGQTVLLSVASQGLVNYQWKLDGAPIGFNSNSINASFGGLYTLEISNSCGSISADNSIQVVVNSVSANITPSGNANICPGDSVLLTADNAASYLWSNGATEQSIYVSQAGTFSVTVSNNNCTASSPNVFVLINSVVPPVILSSSPTNTLCSGASISISSSTEPNYQTYLWSNGLSSSTINVTTGGDYFVTVTTSDGCTTTSNILTLTPIGPEVPVVSSTGNTTFCIGDSVQLSSSVATGNLWLLNGTASLNAIGSSYYATQTGVYSTQIVGDGCTVNSNTISVVANPIPTALASISNQINGNVEFINNSQNFVNSFWNFGDSSQVSSVTNPNHTYLQDGTYTVVLMVENECGADATQITVTIVGTKIYDNKLENKLSVFPNPFSEQLFIRNDSNVSLNGILKISDVSGKLIQSEIYQLSPNSSKILETSYLSKGVYFVEFNSNNYRERQKLIKQ